jgi:hypothetical protein
MTIDGGRGPSSGPMEPIIDAISPADGDVRATSTITSGSPASREASICWAGKLTWTPSAHGSSSRASASLPLHTARASWLRDSWVANTFLWASLDVLRPSTTGASHATAAKANAHTPFAARRRATWFACHGNLASVNQDSQLHIVDDAMAELQSTGPRHEAHPRPTGTAPRALRSPSTRSARDRLRQNTSAERNIQQALGSRPLTCGSAAHSGGTHRPAWTLCSGDHVHCVH